MRLGEHSLGVTSETLLTKEFNVDYILKHPSYNSPRSSSNDIALVRGEEMETFFSSASKSCIRIASEGL